MRRIISPRFTWIALGAGAIAACGSSPTTPGTSTTGTGGHGGTATTGGTGGGTATTSATGSGGSPLGAPCADAYPCPSGYVCDEGSCAVDCGAAARCDGNVCCPSGEVCYLGACTAKGASCAASATGCAAPPCPPGQQCDPIIQACMPVPTAASCTYTPQPSFKPTLLWAWTGSQQYPAYKQVIAAPVVADLDGDGASDIVVPVIDVLNGTPTKGGILCALSGAGDCNGGPRELWCTAPDAPGVNFVSSAAIGDLDGTGELTVVAGAARLGSGPLAWYSYGLVGFDAQGQPLAGFGTDSAGSPVDVLVGVGAPGIADLDHDGHAEVFVGFTVFDSKGKLRWQKPGAVGNASYGPLTIAADLDGDGMLEIVGGNMAYRHDGTAFWAAGAPATTFADGWPAVADFDGDGLPEVVVVSGSANGTASIRVFDRNGQLFTTVAATIPGAGGPPTIADVDGDGVPDIAVAGKNSLTVLRVGAGAGHPLTQMWQTPSRDYSSNFTGSSVFDFEGDGHTEVLYADECYARVYDDAGQTRFEVPNTSCTGTEYPLVADVNGDGKAEFVVVSNNTLGTSSACAPYVQACIDNYPGYQPTNGVRVYRDANDNWVSTRAIWNQHAYHVTNVCDGRDDVCPAAENRAGRIPSAEPRSWSFPAGHPLNRYRANARLDSPLGAADLVARLARADLSGCPGLVTLRASVTNTGAVGAPAGIPVAFYLDGAGGARTLLGVVKTKTALLPGASEGVSLPWSGGTVDVAAAFEVAVDDDGTGAGTVNECHEDNNGAAFFGMCSSGPK
jgi:hypothetical protein